jgi:hypothetical protein
MGQYITRKERNYVKQWWEYNGERKEIRKTMSKNL